jgi:hypothetical protein
VQPSDYLFLVMVCFSLGSMMFYRYWHSRGVRRLRQLADRLDEGRFRQASSKRADLGGISVRGIFEGHRVAVEYENRLHPLRNDAPVFLTIQVEVKHPLPGKLKIERAGVLEKAGRALGLGRGVQTGDPRLDDKYVLNGRPDALSQLLADPQAEASLDELLGPRGFDAVTMVGGRLVVELRGQESHLPWLEAALWHLVQLAKLCDRKKVQVAVLGEAEHFAWTGGGEGPRCPYCRDGIDPQALELAVCEACDTVHHRECLDEAGGCVVFGCGGGKASTRRVRGG